MLLKIILKIIINLNLFSHNLYFTILQVIKMLATIVVLFAMCWFPIHLFQLLVWFRPSIQKQKTTFSYYVYVGSYFACHWLAMAHSLVNPFVYCFMSDNFRVGFFSFSHIPDNNSRNHYYYQLFDINFYMFRI